MALPQHNCDIFSYMLTILYQGTIGTLSSLWWILLQSFPLFWQLTEQGGIMSFHSGIEIG
jgi:hypothetical protein